MAIYSLFVPKQAAGASLVYFDLFVPASSQMRVLLRAVTPIVSGAVAVSGLLGFDLFLTRTSAVGTGGTAATFEGTDTTACTICGIDTMQALTGGSISARLTPSGGATAGSVLEMTSVFTEETGASYGLAPPLVTDPVILNGGSGIRVVQGSVASVGNIAFNVVFEAIQR